ncbi:MAG: MazG nucleotide pyrophosphohydrolase domain-containing protein [Archaeoglobaceae archaeon]|nr:MazG nucleotide pyrophosphohydrolase domain-containing protein [Archaeoglobaceae archaeon]
MEFSKLREILKEKYYPIDSKSSPLFLLSVLFEEVGELAERIRRKDEKGIEEELVDVLFMVLSLANYFGIDVEEKLFEKYVKGDPSKKWDLQSF